MKKRSGTAKLRALDTAMSSSARDSLSSVTASPKVLAYLSMLDRLRFQLPKTTLDAQSLRFTGLGEL